MKNAVWMAVALTAALGTAGCGDDDSAGGGDADSDTDTDTDTDTDFCLPEELRQPETELCWLRCPLGQTWNGSSCEGLMDSMDWCDASGENSSGCSPDSPGQDICELSAGAGYRLPTAEEYSVLLEESGLGNYDGKQCDGDDGDTMCTEMFGYDGGWYWSSTPYDSNDAWFADFGYGKVNNGSVLYDYYVRCVRSGT
ncbi:MAG: DUF1566 domain-containing protein [Polyangia bacterium]